MRFVMDVAVGAGLWVVILGLLLFWPLVPLVALVGWGVVRWRMGKARRVGRSGIWACQLCRADVTRSGERCGACGSLIEWGG